MKVVSAVAVGASVLLSGGTLAGAALLGGLSLLSSTLLSPRRRGGADRQAAQISLALDEGPREVLFGRAATGGRLLDGFNYGGDNGTDWEVLLIALADHECDALEGFFVGDTYHTFSGNGTVPGFNGQLQVYFLPGTETQAWPAIVADNWAGYSPSDNAAGVACVAVAYKADQPDQDNPVWPGGRPNFLCVLRGMKCYQARKDSTVPGGSGSHRWADPSTWEWTANAAECRYQYQRGIYALNRVDQPDQLLIGRGLSEIEAPPERSIPHAVVCDEDVPLKAGGTEKRYLFNGVIDAEEDFLTAEGYFADAMAGVICQPEGGIEVEPGQAKAVSFEITDLDILNLEEVEFEDFRGEADSEWVNTLAGRYVEPTQRWKLHSAPVRRVQADILADGGQRLSAPDLRHVTSGTQAQRIFEIRRRLGRLLKTGKIVLGPRFAEVEEGDWIGWTSARHFNGARVVFRIKTLARSLQWHHTLSLREIAASVYDWDEDVDEIVPTSTATQQTPPSGPSAPSAAAWALTGGLAGGQPALFVTGAVEQAYVTYVLFDYRLDGDTAWISVSSEARSVTNKVIVGGLVASGDYEVRIRYQFGGFIPDGLILGPETTGDPDAP